MWAIFQLYLWQEKNIVDDWLLQGKQKILVVPWTFFPCNGSLEQWSHLSSSLIMLHVVFLLAKIEEVFNDEKVAQLQRVPRAGELCIWSALLIQRRPPYERACSHVIFQYTIIIKYSLTEKCIYGNLIKTIYVEMKWSIFILLN